MMTKQYNDTNKGLNSTVNIEINFSVLDDNFTVPNTVGLRIDKTIEVAETGARFTIKKIDLKNNSVSVHASQKHEVSTGNGGLAMVESSETQTIKLNEEKEFLFGLAAYKVKLLSIENKGLKNMKRSETWSDFDKLIQEQKKHLKEKEFFERKIENNLEELKGVDYNLENCINVEQKKHLNNYSKMTDQVKLQLTYVSRKNVKTEVITRFKAGAIKVRYDAFSLLVRDVNLQENTATINTGAIYSLLDSGNNVISTSDDFDLVLKLGEEKHFKLAIDNKSSFKMKLLAINDIECEPISAEKKGKTGKKKEKTQEEKDEAGSIIFQGILEVLQIIFVALMR